MNLLSVAKKKHFESIIAGDHVMLHLDSNKEGVSVPNNLSKNHAVTLKVSSLFEGEMTYDDDSIVVYLKFSGEYFRCEIPWISIWGMTDENKEQKIWQKDLPKELILEMAKQKIQDIKNKFLKKKKNDKPKPTLKRIK